MNLGKLKTLLMLVVLVALAPAVWACPLCVNATPFKDGLLIAVGFLMFVPFVATYFLYTWVRKASPEENS